MKNGAEEFSKSSLEGGKLVVTNHALLTQLLQHPQETMAYLTTKYAPIKFEDENINTGGRIMSLISTFASAAIMVKKSNGLNQSHS